MIHMNYNIKWIFEKYLPYEILSLIFMYSLPNHYTLNNDFKKNYKLFFNPTVRIHFIKKIQRNIQRYRLRSKLKYN